MLVVENGRNPEGGTIETPFRPSRNPHGATEMRTRDPSGKRRPTNRTCHGATTFPKMCSELFKLKNSIYKILF